MLWQCGPYLPNGSFPFGNGPSFVMSQVIISTKMGSPTYPLAAVTVLRRQRSLVMTTTCGSTTIGIHHWGENGGKNVEINGKP